MNGRFAPQKPQHRIPLLRESPEPLPIAARVFARNQANIAGQCLRVAEARRVAEEYFGGERRDRPDARMRHETPRLWTLLGTTLHFLIEFVDLGREVFVERL